MSVYDRIITNTDINRDIVLNVNVAGTQTPVLTAQGSTGAVIITSLSVDDFSGDSFSLNGPLLATSGSFSSALYSDSLFSGAASLSSVTASGAITTSGSLLASAISSSTLTVDTINLSIKNNSNVSYSSNTSLSASTPDLIFLTNGVTITLPSSGVNKGRTLNFINSGSSVATIQASDNTVVAIVLPASTLYLTALQNTPTNYSHWVAGTTKRQVEKGSSISSSISVSSSSFSNFSTSVTLTFVAAFSAKYRIFTKAVVDQTASTWSLRLNNSAGSATSYWNPNNGSSQNINTPRMQAMAERIDTLVAGTTYTYDLQGATTSTLTVRGDLVAVQIVAEMIE